MRLLKTYWSPAQAYDILMLLDELRDTVLENYHEDIIEYCQTEQDIEYECPSEEDDPIPF